MKSRKGCKIYLEFKIPCHLEVWLCSFSVLVRWCTARSLEVWPAPVPKRLVRVWTIGDLRKRDCGQVTDEGVGHQIVKLPGVVLRKVATSREFFRWKPRIWLVDPGGGGILTLLSYMGVALESLGWCWLDWVALARRGFEFIIEIGTTWCPCSIWVLGRTTLTSKVSK